MKVLPAPTVDDIHPKATPLFITPSSFKSNGTCPLEALHPGTGHAGPQWQKRYSSTRRYRGVSGQRHAQVTLTLGKRPGIHCTECWVGPRDNFDT